MVEAAASLVFWASLAFLAYLHFGYPTLLWVLGRDRPRPVRRGDFTPSVDLIIGAYNEEAILSAKIENCLAVEYPAGKLTVTVASDASTDGTHAVVGEYADRGVRLVVSPRRRGKAANFREAVSDLRGEILVFPDAGSVYRVER